MAISAATAGLIGAGIAAAGSVGSAGISSAKNLKIAKYSADFERERIREQNEYNSPAAQMQRYLDAGLNPNLIYGDGAGAAGNQSQIARYNTPELPVADLGTAAAAAFNFALQRKELQLREQELYNKREEQFNLRSIRHGIDLDNAEKSVLLNYNPGLVLDERSRNDILESRALRKYDLGVEGQEITNAYTKARQEVAKMDAKVRARIVSEIQDLQADLYRKQIEGYDINNEINKVELSLQHSLDELGGRSGVKIIVDLLRTVFGR